MEKALLTAIESAAMSKKSLYKEVIKANANITAVSNANNHLMVSSSSPTPQSLAPLKPKQNRFDLKLICPHGIEIIIL